VASVADAEGPVVVSDLIALRSSAEEEEGARRGILVRSREGSRPDCGEAMVSLGSTGVVHLDLRSRRRPPRWGRDRRDHRTGYRRSRRGCHVRRAFPPHCALRGGLPP